MDDLVKRAKDAMADHESFVSDQGGKILSHGLMPELVARIEALEAEVARLREEHSLIAVMGYGADAAEHEAIARIAVQRARAALAAIGSDK